MATLSILRNMAEVYKIQLQPEKEYLAGRQDSCDIVLDEHAKISRQHFRMAFEGDSWKVHLISRYGELIYNGESTQEIELTEITQFSVGPYTFVYEPTVTSSVVDVNQIPEGQSSHLPAVQHGSSNRITSDEGHPVGYDEVTSPGDVQTIPYIRIKYSPEGQEDLLRLEGNLWVGGRDEQCEIHIDDPSASRRHFEIGQEHGKYFIADLNSSNGTSLNGEGLIPHQSTALNSGDKIEIRDIYIIFELRDPTFQSKLLSVPQNLLIPSSNYSPTSPLNHNYPAVQFPETGILRVPRPPTSRRDEARNLANKRKGPIRFFLMVTIIGLLAFAVLYEDKPKPKPVVANSGSSFDKLSNEQKIFVKQSYELARSLYMQRKYEMARAQLQRLHKIIEIYEDSREIEKLVEQAFLLIQQKNEMDKAMEEQKRLRKEIAGIIDHCRIQLRNSRSVGEAEDCLLPATVKDPTNPGIKSLIDMVAARQQADDERRQARANYEQLASAAREMFSRALNLHNSGKTEDALVVYRRLASSDLPNADNVKDKAKEKIETINAETQRKLSNAIRTAENAFQKQDDRAAIVAAGEALAIVEDNAKALDIRQEARKRLNKALKVIFEDSIIEEGFGEIEPAKDKWKKIMETDTVDGEYYMKAKSKLKKYGG
jgi:pSer/pThr/pTyr-binding forkhead associated (FHA) protein